MGGGAAALHMVSTGATKAQQVRLLLLHSPRSCQKGAAHDSSRLTGGQRRGTRASAPG